MKKLVLLALCFCSTVVFAQNEVSLVVSADGATKTQAIDNALRSAIEQTFGAFVSANTQILNDELVKDDIATVSSGNIQKYSEVAAITLPNGNTSVTLNVTVSLKKLVKYAQSKGAECEFAGATFGANLRLYEFNKKNERAAIENMVKQLDVLRPVYDYEIEVSDPTINKDEKTADVVVKVSALKNEKTELFFNIIKNTIMSLVMTEEQVKPMQDMGLQFTKYSVGFGPFWGQSSIHCCNDTLVKSYFLYNDIPCDIRLYVLKTFWDFSITDNIGGVLYNEVYCPKQIENGFGHVFNNKILTGKTASLNSGGRYTSPYIIVYTDSIQWYNEFKYSIPIDFISKISKISIMSSVNEKSNRFVNYRTEKNVYKIIK